MCPSMSLLAAIMYYPYGVSAFSFATLLANWLKLICYNLPFAFFSQLLFIQPFVRTVFKAIFVRKQTLPEKSACVSDELASQAESSATDVATAKDE